MNEAANEHLQAGRYREAEDAYRRSLSVQPRQVDALVNLGFALGEQERYAEAAECCEQARAIAPDVPEVHHNLGNMLRELGQVERAIAAYDEAIRLRPGYAKAFINKGIALVARGSVPEATACLKRAIELQPDFAEAHNSYAHALSAGGDIDGALAEFEKALELKPDYPDPRWNRSLLWLLRGEYGRGWAEYEWRWKCKRTAPLPALPRPRWDGSDLAGRTILLHAEQGLGDTLQFVRYARLLKHGGASQIATLPLPHTHTLAVCPRVILQCQGTLIPLLAKCAGIDELVAWGAPSPPFDVWLPLLSLPAVLKTELDSIPANVPYLLADEARVARWRNELAALPGLRVGIAWQGSPRHAWDRHRSVPRSAFEPLSRIPGVLLVNLQKGTREESDSGPPFPVIHFGESIDAAGAFTDTAAIMKNLDLVITVDTAVAHLAGGLGVPVWIAIHRTPDWRWLLDRDDSPWYPTARLFRQTVAGDWAPVFDRMAVELAAMAARKQPLLVEVSAGELIDKITILQIKSERITDAGKLANIRRELSALAEVRDSLPANAAVLALENELCRVNERLWEIEDAIRGHESRGDFGPVFIELARAVYVTNDRLAAIKREINRTLDSRLVEEKSYGGAGG